MDRKIRTCITGITVNGPTYKNVSIVPSMLNFFYGKNGTGKSTLARAFKDGSAALSWDGAPYPESQILVYNEDFITKNVQSYGNIPGVFTISEVNAQKKREIDQKTADRKAALDDIKANEVTIKSKEQEKGKYYTEYVEDVWQESKEFREKFPLALAYLRDKKKFADKVDGLTPKQKRYNPDAPFFDEEDMPEYEEESEEVPIPIDEIETLYQTVYGKEQPEFSKYHLFPVKELPVLPTSLANPIISRSDTEFARFIRALGNMDWITQGHTKYHHTAGKCPYCQQEMPATFEDDLAACYDEQYKEDLSRLDAFVKRYKDVLNSIYKEANLNIQNPYPTPLLQEYKRIFDLFMEKARANVATLEKKLATPSEYIDLENLSPLLDEMADIARKINSEIQVRNDVLADIPSQRKKCSDLVWKAIVQRTQLFTNTYRAHMRDIRGSIVQIQTQINAQKKVVNTLAAEITQLNSETVNTTKAMEDINMAIRSAGFKGFFLRKKPGAKYVYQLVREYNGRQDVVEKNLSEGERHFIAFLYFYHMVMGSQSDEGKVEDKIVIIDDPVSSMDSSSLFIVASLTREMIAVCYNNYALFWILEYFHIEAQVLLPPCLLKWFKERAAPVAEIVVR